MMLAIRSFDMNWKLCWTFSWKTAHVQTAHVRTCPETQKKYRILDKGAFLRG
jgi:hypothetical protein